MRFTSLIHSVLLAFVCLEGAEAGFIGALIRGGINAGRVGATAARLAPQTNFFVQNAMRNMRMLLAKPTGKVSGALSKASNTMTSIGKPLTTSEGRKKIAVGLTHDAASGAMAGTVAGSVSSQTGSKLRRNNAGSDRAAMLSRAILDTRQDDEEEPGQPGPAPEGIDQGDWDACFWSMIGGGGVIQLSGEVDWIQISGLPSYCSTVNDGFLAMGDDAGAAKNCGDGCLRYEGLEPDLFRDMADYLNAFSTG